jgi:hypothetical protein
MTVYLIVRAEVPTADRAAFETWYQAEHLPDALKAFQAVSARRGWSDVTPGVHIALYEFTSLSAARTVMDSNAIQGLIAEFDRVWQNRVVRTREVIEITQVL